MAAGKEIKRLRGKRVSAADAASLIGVGVDRLRKWEERDTDPVDTGDIVKVEQYFGCSLTELKDLKLFDFVETPRGTSDYKDKYIASLERENARLQKDLDLSLGELRHNVLLSLAMSEVNQNALIEVLAKQRKTTVTEVALEKNRENDEIYKRLKEEGNFSYVGK